MLLLLGCAALTTAPSTGGARVYDVAVGATFQTTGVDADGEALAALEGLETQTWHVRGVVVMTPSRTYRDDSIGWHVVFQELEEGPSEQGPWRGSGLQGRSFELRAFDDGQILGTRDGEHLTGPPRHGDVLDLLLPTLSPTVPAISAGDSAYRRSSWPFQVSSKSGLRNTLVAEYAHQGAEGSGAARRVELTYSGALEGEGNDARLNGAFSLAGQVDGTVWMRPSDAIMVRHEAAWSRTVVGEYDSGVRVEQSQEFAVSAVLTETP